MVVEKSRQERRTTGRRTLTEPLFQGTQSTGLRTPSELVIRTAENVR